MGKISKSDMPIDRRPHHEIMASYFNSPPCEHFKVGTRVVSNNLGGLVLHTSNDGGTRLIVLWDNGVHGTIRNPNYRANLNT